MSTPARVITLTPAPAIDRTYLVGELHPGAVHRARAVSAELAGKGVNVTANLRLGNIPSLAVIPLSREDSRDLQQDFIHPHPISQSIRVNITLLEDGGQTTKVNDLAPSLTSAEWSGLVETTLAQAREHQSSWVLLAGTIPSCSDAPSLDLHQLFVLGHQEGLLVGLDTSGAPLLELARAGLPDVIKPNAPELAECVGRSLETIGDVIDAAQEVHDWGVAHVLVSLGADGMVGVSDTEVFHARTEPVKVTNTIGAGDASVAGFLSHISHRPSEFGEAISQAVSWGALKVQEQSSQLQSLDGLVPAILTDKPDRSKKLLEPGIV